MTTANPGRPLLTPLEPTESLPHLAPIEKPNSLMLKLLYRILDRQLGKVPMWLRVWSARMPLGYTSWMGKVGKLTKKLKLSQDTAFLVKARVDDLNMCGWCADAGRWQATKNMPHLLPKLDALHEYGTSPVFNAKERAALEFATELTETKHVSSETFAQLESHYSEREICELVWVVSTSHLFNINNHGLNIGSDGFCALSSKAKPAASAA